MVTAVTIPILPMRFREVNPRTQSHAIREDLGSGFKLLESILLPLCIQLWGNITVLKPQAKLGLEMWTPNLQSRTTGTTTANSASHLLGLSKPLTSNLGGSDPHSIDTASHSVPNSLGKVRRRGVRIGIRPRARRVCSF